MKNIIFVMVIAISLAITSVGFAFENLEEEIIDFCKSADNQAQCQTEQFSSADALFTIMKETNKHDEMTQTIVYVIIENCIYENTDDEDHTNYLKTLYCIDSDLKKLNDGLEKQVEAAEKGQGI